MAWPISMTLREGIESQFKMFLLTFASSSRILDVVQLKWGKLKTVIESVKKLSHCDYYFEVSITNYEKNFTKVV